MGQGICPSQGTLWQRWGGQRVAGFLPGTRACTWSAASPWQPTTRNPERQSGDFPMIVGPRSFTAAAAFSFARARMFRDSTSTEKAIAMYV